MGMQLIQIQKMQHLLQIHLEINNQLLTSSQCVYKHYFHLPKHSFLTMPTLVAVQ